MDISDPVLVDLAQLPVKVNQLPLQATSFIGREQEIAHVGQLLTRPEVRLLTLTGPGGVGKTRLALKVAERLLDSFNRVNFVRLAQVRDWQQILPTLAQTLELPGNAQIPVLAQLIDFLRPEQRLLVLDNFEQVAEAAPQVGELLAACPALKVLVTSRAPLHIGGEHEFPVAPLELPDLKNRPDPAQLALVPSIKLFLQRAKAVNPYFALNESTAVPVAEICVCLDGLPLALELAAARCKLLPPQALLERLVGSDGKRLKLLVGGAKDAQVRQQTLRNTIDWSYELLEDGEKRLFRRLAVFYGGFSLEAAEAMLEDAETSLEILSSLVDKNLVRRDEVKVFGQVTARFRMLEIIREYAFEKLAAHAELETAYQRQAAYCLDLAEQAEPELKKKNQLAWIDRLELDYDNIRVVLKWAYAGAAGGDRSAYEVGLGIIQALWWFWMIRGMTRESYEKQQEWLALEPPFEINGRAAQERAKIFYEAGLFAIYMGKPDRAAALCDEGLKLNRASGYLFGVGSALWIKACVLQIKGEYQKAWAMSEESRDTLRLAGDPSQGAPALYNMGLISKLQENYSLAQANFEEGLAGFREAGDFWSTAHPLYGLGVIAQLQGNYENAIKYFEENLLLNREARAQLEIPYSLLNLGSALLAQGNLERAQRLYQESLDLFRESGIKRGLATALLGLGEVEFSRQDYGRARVLLDESVALYREVEDRRGLASALNFLALAVLRLGKTDLAATFAGESFSLYREVGTQADLALGLETQGEIEAKKDNFSQAVHLYAEADRLRQANKIPLPPTYRFEVEARLERARSMLGPAEFERAWNNLPGKPETAPATPVRPKSPDELTARELEVLRLVALGLTNSQVAEKLIVSPATVNAHLTSIYGKLGVNSRSAATRYALDNKLI